MRYGTKIIATHSVTGEQIHFNSIRNAAEFAQMKATTMSFRVKHKSKLLCEQGYLYEAVEPTEEQLLKRVMRKDSQTERVFRSDDVELDPKYRIVTYEVRNLRECITPCPYRDDLPRPMIGSVNCVKCGSFKGRNKATHQVACSRIGI